MIRYVVALIVAIALLAIFYKGLSSDPSELPSQYIGKPAPQFDLPTVRDPAQRVSNKDLVGHVSLVNIWATWCDGCRIEHPFLNALAQRDEIPIFAINWRDNLADAQRWLSSYGDPYVASGFDEDGRVGIDWGVYGAPETFLLDASGVVVYRFTGPLNQTIWEQEFVPRIAELRP